MPPRTKDWPLWVMITERLGLPIVALSVFAWFTYSGAAKLCSYTSTKFVEPVFESHINFLKASTESQKSMLESMKAQEKSIREVAGSMEFVRKSNEELLLYFANRSECKLRDE